MSTLANLFDRIAHPRILVLGDLILDRYTFGNAERVSPEAPVVVLRVDEREVRLGGAASIAMLLRALEAEAVLAGVIGDDQDGHTLRSLLADHHIDGGTIITDADRPTTTKERVIGRAAGRHGNQIVRVDHESREPLDPATEDALIGLILFELSDFQAILISDYAKGVCTKRLLQTVIRAGKELGIPVIVDPARIDDWGRYAGATLLKPNRHEAEFASGRKIVTPADALAAGETLRERFAAESLVITLDRDGMALVQAASCRCCPSPSSNLDPPSSTSLHFPIAPHEVYDITGAGDMVLAALGLCLASGISLPESVQVANAAAGLEVEKLGVAPITRAELRAALASPAAFSREAQPSAMFPAASNSHNTPNENPGAGTDSTRIGSPGSPNVATASPSSILHPQSSSASKLTTLAALIPLRNAYQGEGKSVTFTNGCFDLLHVGHVTMLEQAAALGDVLIVAVNSDATVRALKGPDRPIIPEHDRAQLLASLDCVDHVLIFDDRTPHHLLSALRPNVLAKGGTTGEIVGHEVVEIYGGSVVHLPAVPNRSTTALLSKFRPAFSREAQPSVEAASCRLPVQSIAPSQFPSVSETCFGPTSELQPQSSVHPPGG